GVVHAPENRWYPTFDHEVWFNRAVCDGWADSRGCTRHRGIRRPSYRSVPGRAASADRLRAARCGSGSDSRSHVSSSRRQRCVSLSIEPLLELDRGAGRDAGTLEGPERFARSTSESGTESL